MTPPLSWKKLILFREPPSMMLILKANACHLHPDIPVRAPSGILVFFSGAGFGSGGGGLNSTDFSPSSELLEDDGEDEFFFSFRAGSTLCVVLLVTLLPPLCTVGGGTRVLGEQVSEHVLGQPRANSFCILLSMCCTSGAISVPSLKLLMLKSLGRTVAPKTCSGKRY